MKGSEFLEGVQRVDMSRPDKGFLTRLPGIIVMEDARVVSVEPAWRLSTEDDLQKTYGILEKGLITVISGESGEVDLELPLDSVLPTRRKPLNITPAEPVYTEPIQTVHQISKIRSLLNRLNPFKMPDPNDPSIEF